MGIMGEAMWKIVASGTGEEKIPALPNGSDVLP